MANNIISDTVTLAKLRQVIEFLWQGVFLFPPCMHMCLLEHFKADEQNSIFKPSEAIIVKEHS